MISALRERKLASGACVSMLRCQGDYTDLGLPPIAAMPQAG
jgi:hypothetical protein